MVSLLLSTVVLSLSIRDSKYDAAFVFGCVGINFNGGGVLVGHRGELLLSYVIGCCFLFPLFSIEVDGVGLVGIASLKGIGLDEIGEVVKTFGL